MRMVVRKFMKYTIIMVVIVILFFCGVAVHAVQSWHMPCDTQSTPTVPYPCGEER